MQNRRGSLSHARPACSPPAAPRLRCLPLLLTLGEARGHPPTSPVPACPRPPASRPCCHSFTHQRSVIAGVKTFICVHVRVWVQPASRMPHVRRWMAPVLQGAGRAGRRPQAQGSALSSPPAVSEFRTSRPTPSLLPQTLLPLDPGPPLGFSGDPGRPREGSGRSVAPGSGHPLWVLPRGPLANGL